jgi:hypothetical protein
MIPFIQRVLRRCSPASRGSALQLVACQQTHHLDRECGNVEVRRVLERLPVGDDGDAPDPAGPAVDRLHLVLRSVVDSQLAQVRKPRIDPDVVGGTVQHPVCGAART